RAAGLPQACAALSGAERGTRQEDAGCVDGDDPGAMSAARQSHVGWASVTPALLWTLVFFAIPFVAMVVASLFPQNTAGPGLAGYVQFFANESYWRSLTNSLEVTILVTVISILLAYPFAWILVFVVPERWQRLALMLAVLPFWTSYVVRSY